MQIDIPGDRWYLKVYFPSEDTTIKSVSYATIEEALSLKDSLEKQGTTTQTLIHEKLTWVRIPN